ncbi:DMT family transporter [Polyangium mundeleinium]|uniref:EamA family transporter n=1 Tax=Polyangium mundeleinium TaxID=2995306 RepID=A0ABT5EMS4_9BACT|nr:EamA family transporter [Polyangium mundeleinium]MDC0742045.1 EamA family transporter [Polyangium mundeleinium]
MPPGRIPVPLLVCLALLGFAGNSLLCRAALADGATRIDPATFTTVRLASGAATLVLLLLARGARPHQGTFRSAFALFAYAAGFSLAYVRIGAGIGALVLFGCVQTTMLGAGLLRGERPSVSGWIGLVLALGGLLVLAAPGATAPDPVGALLMATAGVAWGLYSLRGRSAENHSTLGGSARTSRATPPNPLAATADNFVRAVPLTLALSLASACFLEIPRASPRGLLLAVASGALASGVGYSLWYAALPRLTAIRAAVVQLLVPVLATAGSVLLLGEHLTPRIALAGAMLATGVLLALRRREAVKRA